jgi:peptide/nickel transport system permease protein
MATTRLSDSPEVCLVPHAMGLRHPPRWLLAPEIALPATLLLAILACLLWPSIYPLPQPVGGNVLEANLPPLSLGHLLGTDTSGNDVWSRLLHGGRTSLLIALSVNLIGLCAGGVLGAASAYFGGLTDTIIMRLLDALIAFPSLVLVLAVAQALGPGTINTIWALTFFSVPAFARIARAATLRVREQPFITAAHLSGTRALRVLTRHIAPNILPQLTTFGLLGMGVAINIEGAVSFLGLGVPLPQPSWGNMIYQGQMTLSATPLLVLLPSALLFVTVLAFNLLGEALRALVDRK